MKRTSSLVWRFFDRIEEDKRCVSVLCKLCDTQYKYFGNTTNLRTHLVSKHPIQWELLQNGSLDESTFRAAFDPDETTSQTNSSKKKKYGRSFIEEVRYSVSVDLNNEENNTTENKMPIISIQRVNALDESDDDHNQTHEEDLNVVHIEAQGSDEEWLNEELYETVEAYEPRQKKMKFKKIKQEITSPKVSSYYVKTPKVKYQRSPQIMLESPKKDEFSVFGEYIANKLRKLKNPNSRANVQQLMTTILWGAEYGMYENMETVKRVILHSLNEMPVQELEVIQSDQIIVQQETSKGEEID
ncbi:uncharacterized protein LOC121736008 isoform X1 [Aricia agestis]|uniref:uncharacterized protein LOC121736008 isoform X1 n=1 Tax=Aricia agestis TaxID=91739 RepID=UPI001C20261F|nr:uncharacterized protein LOC121736008 isoform X1 [Aricia agestis]